MFHRFCYDDIFCTVCFYDEFFFFLICALIQGSCFTLTRFFKDRPVFVYCVFVVFIPVTPNVIDIMIINKGAVLRDSGQISLEIVVIEPLHTARFN